MKLVLLNALLQLIAGTLWGFGLFGGAQVRTLLSASDRTAALTSRWFNWFPEYFSPRPSRALVVQQHFATGGFACLIPLAIYFLLGPNWGWVWLTAPVALVLIACSLALIVGFKQRYLRGYLHDRPDRVSEVPLTRVHRLIWILTSPSITAQCVAFLTIAIAEYRGWTPPQAFAYGLFCNAAFTVALAVALATQWISSMSGPTRVLLAFVGVLFYMAGTYVTM